MTTYTLTLPQDQAAKLEAYCITEGLNKFTVAYAQFAYKGPTVTVVYYASGKIVIQGKEQEKYISLVTQNTPEITPHVGLDECGKGDVFGPMVTACVYVDKEAAVQFQRMGVRDSKTLSINEVFRLEGLIRAQPNVVYEVVSTTMEEYNFYMGKALENMNVVLAWLHKRALNPVVQKTGATWGVLDKFSNEQVLKEYLALPGFSLTVKYHGEDDVAVAAASILARAEQLRAFEVLSKNIGYPLLRGASAEAQQQAADIVLRSGFEYLAQYAKLNFKPIRALRNLSKV